MLYNESISYRRSGFIGSNLCEYLLAHNYEVVCLDNFATGKIENLLPLLNQYPDTFKLIVGDIRNFSDCQKAVVGVIIFCMRQHWFCTPFHQRPCHY